MCHILPITFIRAMKRKGNDDNGFIVYHHAKKTKTFHRAPEVGPFVDTMPEIRMILYCHMDLTMVGRIGRTCKAMSLEMFKPGEGWAWMPTTWIKQMRGMLPFRREAWHRVFHGFLMPRRFFHRVKCATSFVNMTDGYDTGSLVLAATHADLNKRLFLKFVGTSSTKSVTVAAMAAYTTPPYICSPPADEIDAFITEVAARGRARASENKKRNLVPQELRLDLLAATNERNAAHVRAKQAADTVHGSLRHMIYSDRHMPIGAARDIVAHLEAIVALNIRIDAYAARIKAIKSGEEVVEIKEDAMIVVEEELDVNVDQESDSDT